MWYIATLVQRILFLPGSSKGLWALNDIASLFSTYLLLTIIFPLSHSVPDIPSLENDIE